MQDLFQKFIKNFTSHPFSFFSKYLESRFALTLGKRRLSISYPALFFAIFFGFTLTIFCLCARLNPQIGENFFFSNEDPKLQEFQKIQELFPQDPQIIMGVRGNIESREYLEKINKLSWELSSLPDVISVQSISHGPRGLKEAKEGELWSRILLAKDMESTLVNVFVESVPPEELIPEIEEIAEAYHGPGFEVMISGEPYITELLSRYLSRDFKVFSSLAFILFGTAFLFLFRSYKILLGTLFSCGTAGMMSILLSQVFGIEIGPLTANLATIVFILTLSHIIFLTHNWLAVQRQNKEAQLHPAVEAMKMTLWPSFWSMLTTLLGFLSLLMVQALPLRQLGASGAIGAVAAMFHAYLIFPVFLGRRHVQDFKGPKIKDYTRQVGPLFSTKQKWLFVSFLTFVLFCGGGVFFLNPDPSLLDYFRKQSELRQGLEYIDQNGGSSPLFLVVEDPEGKKFNDREGYQRLWDVTESLEKVDEVGSAVSLPIILAQAKRHVIAKLLTMEWLIDLLETERFGKVAQYFITEDRTKALILLRMREEERTDSRVDVLSRLKNEVNEKNFRVLYAGGVYSLQGQMAKLVTSSLVSGILLLMTMFFLMAWYLSRSIKLAFFMGVSLFAIPVVILGLMGYFRIPLDVIATPAVNIALAVSVDAMIHMLIFVRRTAEDIESPSAWKKASVQYRKPVLYTSMILAAGFGIFMFSGFPPTIRFGFMLTIGAFLLPLCALLSFVSFMVLKMPIKFNGRSLPFMRR